MNFLKENLLLSDIAPQPASRRLSRWLTVATVLVFGGAIGYGIWDILLRPNFRVVIPGKVYRSAQLAPLELENYLRKHQIRTLLNLRGDAGDATKREEAVAAKAGVRMITVELSSNTPPTRKTMRKLLDALETAEPPILLHCFYGNDRSGLASMFAAMALGRQNYGQAKQQLCLWMLHRNDKGQTLTDVVGWYEDYCRTRNMSPDNWPQMKDWLLTKYDPHAPPASQPITRNQ